MSSTGPATLPAKFDPALEGLRGLACLLVLFFHLIGNEVDPNFQIDYFWYQNLTVGKEAVLIFFLISGYVIGLVSLREYSPDARRNYLWKRFVRLVPLYWLALIFSVAALPIDSFKTIIPQFFFLQNTESYFGLRFTVLKANGNLWSLNYEIIYYLTFLLVWRLRPGARALGRLIFILAAIGVSGWIFPHQPRILTGYAVGGVFWYAGLWLVWYGESSPETESRRWPWISIWLLLFITPHLDALNLFMKSLGWAWPSDPKFPYVCLRDLQVFPIGLIILAGATRRKLPMSTLIWTLALTQPLLLVGWYVVTWNMEALRLGWVPVLLTALMVCFWPLRQTSKWMIWLCPTGLISYGIYIFGRPVQWFVSQHFHAVSGTWFTFVVRIMLILSCTFLIGHFTELVLQPRIRSWLERRFASYKKA